MDLDYNQKAIVEAVEKLLDKKDEEIETLKEEIKNRKGTFSYLHNKRLNLIKKIEEKDEENKELKEVYEKLENEVHQLYVENARLNKELSQYENLVKKLNYYIKGFGIE